jgi:hypothetical protein
LRLLLEFVRQLNSSVKNNGKDVCNSKAAKTSPQA